MSSGADSSLLAEIVRHARAFILRRMELDAIRLRPDKPRVRGPLTRVATDILRTLTFQFENVLTGLCTPSLATIARASGCSESSVKRSLPSLRKAGYVEWGQGKRKRMRTRVGWRVVRSANRYQLTCPRQYLSELRSWLIRRFRGQHGPEIQLIVNRVTPPTEKAKAAEQIVAELTADLRPNPARTTTTAPPSEVPDPPSQGPPAAQGSVDIAGIQITDPKLGSALTKLWAAMEKRERSER